MYRKAVVTFLDILGFADLVKTQGADTVKHCLETVRKFALSDADANGDIAPISFAFSDSIVRVRFVDTKLAGSFGMVFDELLDMVHIQGELIAHDVILRGRFHLATSLQARAPSSDQR